jgi:hypothetical protein
MHKEHQRDHSFSVARVIHRVDTHDAGDDTPLAPPQDRHLLAPHKRVPKDLIPVVGRELVQQTLDTRDPAEAKRRLVAALTKLEEQWASLRAGPTVLSEREAHELAADSYNRWLAIHRDEPSQQTAWRTDLFERMWVVQPIDFSAKPDALLKWDKDGPRLREQEVWCEGGAGDLLAARGLVIDEASRLKVAKAIALAIQRASLVLARLARGEADVDQTAPPVRRPLQDGGSQRAGADARRNTASAKSAAVSLKGWSRTGGEREKRQG